MRILHVIDQFNQQLHGGSAVVPYQLSKAQAKLGHNVTIYTSDYKAGSQQAPEGVKLVKFKTVFSISKLQVTPGMYLASWNYDIIHLHNYRTLVNFIAIDSLMLRLHPPLVVLQAHGNAQPRAWRPWLRPLAKTIWIYGIFRHCDHYIADAEIEINHYLKQGAKIQDISIIPVGIDLDSFNQLPPKNTNGHKTVLYMGRLDDKTKGLGLLMDAIKEIGPHGIRLVIAGPDYGYGQETKQKAINYGIQGKVDFVGPVSGQQKVDLLSQADVFVMPSRYEMWGLSFMEALACGTPVVMTDQCGAAGTLPRECGTVVPLDSVKMAGAISNMLRYDFAGSYRDYRKKWVSQFSWDSIAKQTINLYEDLLARRCLP